MQQKSFALGWCDGDPSPDRMDLSMDQYNVQVRKSALSGACLWNQQRGTALCIRDVSCIILACSSARERVRHEGAAVVCTAVGNGRSFQCVSGASIDLLGLLWSKESGSCFPHRRLEQVSQGSDGITAPGSVQTRT